MMEECQVVDCNYSYRKRELDALELDSLIKETRENIQFYEEEAHFYLQKAKKAQELVALLESKRP
jgi:transcriptional regulator